MNRPDLDALEREYVTPNDDAGEDVKELIAYARHLESRIAELEEALERIAGDSVGDAHSSDIAAEVLKRKGA